MASPPKPKPVRHLVALCERLDLEPVLRHMRQSECLTGEHAQLIRSHPTSHLRIEALVDLLNSDERIAEFMLALWATGQTDLAELIDQPSDPTMTVSRSQPSLATQDTAAEPPRAREATSSQGSSSSQAEVIQLRRADLFALFDRRLKEVTSSPELVKTTSGGSLEARGASEAQLLRAFGPIFPTVDREILASDSALSSTARLPAGHSKPGSPAQRRVREATTSETLASNKSTPQDAKALEASVVGSFMPQIVIAGGAYQMDKMELIDVNSRQSVLLTLDRPRLEHSCAQVSPGRLLLAGGRCAQGKYIDCDNVTVQSSPPFARMERGICQLQSSLLNAAMAANYGGTFLAGGTKDLGNETSDMNHFDGAKWFPRKAMPRPRRGFALLPLGEERLYAVGGFGKGLVDCYDVGRDEWHTLQGPGPIIRSSATLVGRRIYALPHNKSYDELFILDLESERWSEGPKLNKSRSYPGLVGVGGRLVALGGTGKRSVEVLDLRAGRWKLLEDFQLKMDTTEGAHVCTIDL